MAWVTVPGSNNLWEYDNNPADPGVIVVSPTLTVDHPERALWYKQTAGIRTDSSGHQVYTKCRKIGTNVDTMGELSKTYYDNQ